MLYRIGYLIQLKKLTLFVLVQRGVEFHEVASWISNPVFQLHFVWCGFKKKKLISNIVDMFQKNTSHDHSTIAAFRRCPTNSSERSSSISWSLALHISILETGVNLRVCCNTSCLCRMLFGKLGVRLMLMMAMLCQRRPCWTNGEKHGHSLRSDKRIRKQCCRYSWKIQTSCIICSNFMFGKNQGAVNSVCARRKLSCFVAADADNFMKLGVCSIYISHTILLI